MSRVEEIASQFETVTAEALATIGAADESKFQNTSGEEGWTAAFLAHHIATGLEPISGLVQGIAKGAEMPALTMEMLHEQNAQNASANAKAPKAETLATLRSASALAGLRALSDADLDKSAQVIGNPMTTEQAAQGILIGHVSDHIASFKATIG
ncbi:MAG: Mycothiol maleylpyruvate isomerase N-terminal domain-containing protein [Chloroflexi bacterium]|jgi:hypothetical protein|nr:MAG: Mycothiol maleylpyruvate isomerase N-terminal domain-containing protein [Chloroflexota bacterium]